MTSTWTSSARRRTRLRATAIRHAQIQGLAIRQLLVDPRDRVIDRRSILSCRPFRDCVPSRLCPETLVLDKIIPHDAHAIPWCQFPDVPDLVDIGNEIREVTGAGSGAIWNINAVPFIPATSSGDRRGSSLEPAQLLSDLVVGDSTA